MADTNAATPSRPEVGSEEWVQAKLDGTQAPAEVSETQGQAPAEDSAPVSTIAATAPTAPKWSEVVIPSDDDTADGFFRGKPVAEVHKSFKTLQSDNQEQRRKVHELEAKLAAQQAVSELVRELKPPQPAPTPVDPYKARGVDVETDWILNPTKVAAVQNDINAQTAAQAARAEVDRFKQELAVKEQLRNDQERAAWALDTVKRERNLTDDQMRQRVGYLLFETTNRHKGADGLPDKNALFDPAKILEVHDSVWSAQAAPVATPANVSVPNPPGSKQTAAVETVQTPQLGLKQYEREALAGAAEALKNSNYKIDPERLLARYAAKMKEVRR